MAQVADQTRAAIESASSRVVTVSVFPVVQHKHPDGAIVTVRLRRIGGDYRTLCHGCGTEFRYRKPQRSLIAHHKSPLLPEIKGNFDDSDGDRH
jgi:hypothetical protein